MNTTYPQRQRRRTVSVRVGNTAIGGDNPVRVQSMTNTPTLDTEASVAQVKRIADAGADLVRLTAQGVAHARNLGNIARRLHDDGYNVPLVADIHFSPAAAFESALHVDKVRINPGNFVDQARTFRNLEYTDDEYAAELQKIEDKLVPLLDLCRQRGVAIRLGVNHGSLSDRIMSRFGNTPAGMTESAMEYLRIARRHNFNDIVLSIKASNVCVMTETVRTLVAAMDAEDMHYPLHLGVTEAGDGEDGRVKSCVGIGTLLAEGFGDTIRVSLSEAPEAEVPVARMLLDHINRMTMPMPACAQPGDTANNGGQSPLVVGYDRFDQESYHVIAVEGCNAAPLLRKHASEYRGDNKVLLVVTYPADMTPEQVTVAASVDLGATLLDGYGDAVCIFAPSMTDDQLNSLALAILQATRRRFSHTEYIACPGCGRTLFDLQRTLADVRGATNHLAGLKIAVMGCIVNGPGEMADADYGYVGAAAGHISLYRGKECVEKNIPQDQAIDRLVALLKADGVWTDKE